MRITYNAEVDALYIRFRETTVTTKHLAEGLAVDYAWTEGNLHLRSRSAEGYLLPVLDRFSLRVKPARSCADFFWAGDLAGLAQPGHKVAFSPFTKKFYFHTNLT